MIKKDIIEEITKETGLSKPVVRLVIEKFITQMRTSLLEKQRIELRNFGVFKVKKVRPKKGRNLKTGETVPVPERWKVTFKPSKVFLKLNSPESEQQLPFDSPETGSTLDS
ncbi:MAG: Integration host factor subunit alpha [candidate division TA06 bacterium ADurb.Bin131]|uniref:Integration host factor subunit alpha n=1 Tax=candidate division TA06 bacterium ADurb.Bin131 TaxID=1852827 RepID=A0A1V6C677_UNCT6|nr:MAG: Integration host factor subunit alpha [candidate division TA06 bacterium ADurb.Bin131]